MRWVAVALLLAPTGAFGASGKVGKALNELDKFGAGERTALESARKAADQATESAKSAVDPEAWAVRGRVYLLHLTNPDLPRPDGDPASLAVECFEKSVELGAAGAVHGELARWVPVLESTVVAALLNDVEGKQWDVAAQRLDLVLRVRALGEKLGGRDDEREAQSRRLAVQITARNGQEAEAKAHYEAFVQAAQRHDPGLAGLVARELAEAGDLDAALTFLAPLDDDLPDDERLLRTEVDLLRDGGRVDDAVARIDKAAESLQTSVSGAFLAASLYAEAGAEERARELWERTVALDARHFEAQLLLGQSLLAQAAELKKALAAAQETEDTEPTEEIEAMVQELDDLWVRVHEHLTAARDLDSQRIEPLQGLIEAAEAQLDGIDAEALSGDAKAAREERIEALERLKTALSALEG